MEEQNELLLSEALLKDKIYVIRGVQVMLDSDLAEIYGYTTKRFNEQVKNNIERFDEEERFQLTDNEFRILRSKNSTSCCNLLVLRFLLKRLLFLIRQYQLSL